LKKWISLIQINFIVSPEKLELAYEKIDNVIDFWFKTINIIPVMLTIRWDNKSMVKLNKFIKYIVSEYINNDKKTLANIYKFSYFDWVPVEIWLIVDTDLSLYQDSSDELFIWKQFNELWDKLIEKVENATFLWNLKDNKKLSFFISKYDIKSIVELLHSLPEQLWYLKDYAIIYRIMNSNKNERSNMWGNIYDILTSKIS